MSFDTTTYETVTVEVADHVATVTLNRPDRLNAFTGTMMAELIDVLDRTDVDDDVRAIIITGAGRGFCAGADLESGGETFDYTENNAREKVEVQRDGGGRLTTRIFSSTTPIIAAINGPAVGVGITMTLPMDIRLVAESARVGFVFARRGIVPEAASSWFLPRLVGISKALEWSYSGRVFGAAEAAAAGLATLVPDDELLDRARAIATEIATHAAPVSAALTRQLMWQGLTFDHPMQSHRADSRAIQALGAMDDAKEGVMSFLEKRDPEWRLKPSVDTPDVFPFVDPPSFS
ncbi:MAG: enoyl-CoA hydratase-related protein [Acidimicrobiales bacterium]